MECVWDRGLPALALNKVTLHAGSLGEAWQALSSKYLVRSILVTSGRAVEDSSFEHRSNRCPVGHFYDAIVSRYQMAWVQDQRTGVAWLHPHEWAYDDLLATKVHVARDHLGLPMQTGILEPLGKPETTHFIAKEWGTLFRNMFDYAVDIPAGRYAVRDILNLCAVANPTKTFLVKVRPKSVVVTAVSLGSDESGAPTVGALHLWDSETGIPRAESGPTKRQVVSALAHRQSKVRSAARNYLESIIHEVEIEEWVNDETATEQALWTCIGVLSILVRTREVTYRRVIEMTARFATDDFLAQGYPGLALITALELARLTENTRALEIVNNRVLRADELLGVHSDACRVASLSGFVRKALRVENTRNIVEKLPLLQAMVRSSGPPRLGFQVS
ncbi:MAG TPA: hypothetical protein VLV83_02135 [Acidobacteriota bacterium]|nr:hypothetical protein [Acidobacteriota bacterium]